MVLVSNAQDCAVPWWEADQDNAGLGRAKYVHRADKSKNTTRRGVSPCLRSACVRPVPAPSRPPQRRWSSSAMIISAEKYFYSKTDEVGDFREAMISRPHNTIVVVALGCAGGAFALAVLGLVFPPPLLPPPRSFRLHLCTPLSAALKSRSWWGAGPCCRMAPIAHHIPAERAPFSHAKRAACRSCPA